MSNTKTEAQRIADFAQQLSDEGPKIHALVWPLLTGACLMFSDELHRLDAENQQLRAQLAKAVESKSELLEALIWMVDNDETNEGDEPVESLDGESWNDCNRYWIDGLNRARAAIAKATGEHHDN